MIPEFGHFALILALIVAILQAILPLYGAQVGNIGLQQLARRCAYLQCLLLSTAFSILMYAFINNDFSVMYVAANSNRHLPLVYRACAVWGAHEGSLLLWVAILSVWMAAVAWFSKQLPLATVSRVLSVLAMISIGFLAMMLLTSNPFTRILPMVPTDGRDLNPLLQDPGLIGHPPMLYMGYVGFSVAFAFTISALIGGQWDKTWARWSRPWTLIAWCFLTLGITLGSWWSYRVLGWGGWWAWDPVENASFLPWLAGTALIHSLMVAEKRDNFKAWTMLLAICAFSLSLMGTFLVRSGVLVSVHAFSVDPSRGLFILAFLGIVVGGALTLYLWRVRNLTNSLHFRLFSRETFLLANNVILLATMLTVLLGTVYPLLIDTLGLGKLSVGAPYFNLVFIPLMIPLLVLMGAGPMSRWQHIELKALWLRARASVFSALLLSLALPKMIGLAFNWRVSLGLLLSFWVILASVSTVIGKKVTLNRTRLAMILAHVGVAVCVLGVVVSQVYSVERDVRLAPKDSVTLGAYQFNFTDMKNVTGPNYHGVQATILVKKGGKVIAQLAPQLRRYPVSDTTRGEIAINAGIFRDLYVALGQPLDHNSWSFRIYNKPLIRWIWGGGLLMVLGSLIAVSDKRYRKIQTTKGVGSDKKVGA